MAFFRKRTFFAASVFLVALQAQAWDKHESIMPWILDSFPSDVHARLKAPIQAPCVDEDRQIYLELRSRLALNPSLDFDQLKLKPTAESCKKTTTALEILARGFVDDPDQGMDKDLPDSADPAHERTWMGGKTGPSSQGFRHMYFGGWRLSRPIETFQIPTYAIGQAPVRAQVMANEARRLFSEGKTAWGWRVISWELHYLQDLAQPFHSVQVLSPRMLNLGVLATHPGNFGAFVQDTTRVITNYHWAYEGLVLQELRLGVRSPLAACLTDAAREANLLLPEGLSEREDALAVANASVEIGTETGRGVLAAFGTALKDPSSDLIQDRGTPDYAELATSRAPGVLALNQATCRALSNAILISKKIITAAGLPKR